MPDLNGWDPKDERGCGEIRDLLPLLGLGALEGPLRAAVEQHLLGCAECSSQERFLTTLQGARAIPPGDLLHGIMVRVRAGEGAQVESGALRPRLAGASGWGAFLLPAAAVVILALGIGIRRPEPSTLAVSPPTPLLEVALDPSPGTIWYGDDWVVAGDPQLTALSDEVLLRILEEMER